MVERDEASDTFLYDTSGYSMWPFLLPLEKLVVKKTAFEQVRVGDIIIYRAEGKLICHRVVKKAHRARSCLLYSRGDASLSSPEAVNPEMFAGKAFGILKDERIVSLDTRPQHLLNRLIVIFAPVITYIVKIIMAIRK